MIRNFLEFIIFIIKGISVFILTLGAIISFISFLKAEFTIKDKSNKIHRINCIRFYLAKYILISLEFLVCSGIIVTVLKPSFHDIMILASTIVIRNIISYFLKKESKSIKKTSYLPGDN